MAISVQKKVSEALSVQEKPQMGVEAHQILTFLHKLKTSQKNGESKFLAK